MSSIISQSRADRPFAYTGTAGNPDVVSLFLKSDRVPGGITYCDDHHAHAIAHDFFYFRGNLVHALGKIQAAVESIFQMTKVTGNDGFWNAWKNLARGMIQIVPFLGNGILYAYDHIKTLGYIHPQIRGAIAHQQKPTLGVALDGRVVFSVPLKHAKFATKNFSEGIVTRKSQEEMFAVFQYTYWASKKRQLTKQTKVAESKNVPPSIDLGVVVATLKRIWGPV